MHHTISDCKLLPHILVPLPPNLKQLYFIVPCAVHASLSKVMFTALLNRRFSPNISFSACENNKLPLCSAEELQTQSSYCSMYLHSGYLLLAFRNIFL